MTTPHQIHQAVTYALSPHHQSQAFTYLDQIKQSAHQFDIWTPCLLLFLGDNLGGNLGGNHGGSNNNNNGNVDGDDGSDGGGMYYDGQTRMFALQVLDEALSNKFDLVDQAALTSTLQQSFFTYIQKEYVEGNGERGLTYLKNNFTRTLFYLFMRTYPTTSPNFFDFFLSILRTPTTTTNGVNGVNEAAPTSTSTEGRLNPQTTDLFLRLLHEISVEISDSQLRLNKPHSRLELDSNLRNAIRDTPRDGFVTEAGRLMTFVWEIVREGLEGLESGAGGIGEEITEMAMRVVGDYVSWIDINLMITSTTVPLLHRAINPSPSSSPTQVAFIRLRIAAAEALIETASKGMPAGDKLQLIQILQLGEMLTGLRDVGRVRKDPKGANNEFETDIWLKIDKENINEEVELFREKLAKLLGTTGTELISICNDNKNGNELQTLANQLCTAFLPLLLSFLSDPYDDTSANVFSFAQSILSRYKKEKTRAPNNLGAVGHLGEEGSTKRKFLEEMLKVVVGKMEWDDEAEWGLGEEGEMEEAVQEFRTVRKSLKQLFDGIAAVYESLFASTVHSLVLNTINAFANSPPGSTDFGGVTWQRAELAMYLIHLYGEAAQAGASISAYVQIPDEILNKAKTNPNYTIYYDQHKLSALGEMLFRSIKANIVSFPHPAVSLMFFEVVVRYHEFFRICPDCVGDVLPSFMDERGIHQSDSGVRCRVYYLFSRFITVSKGMIQSQVSGQLIDNILSRMQDLLVITAELPQPESPQDDILVKAAESGGAFDSQLYLFQTMGILISILNQIPDQQEVLLRAGISPLINGVQSNIRTSINSTSDLIAILQVHHHIMAIGNVAKGFPDVSPRNPSPSGQWVQVFSEATESILGALKMMSGVKIIRQAACFAFNRIAPTAGTAVLPYIPTLIDCLVNQVDMRELEDFLSFMINVIHKYQKAFADVLDALIAPLSSRVMFFLDQPITGTDDKMQHSGLCQKHFYFIDRILANDMQDIFLSEKNKPQFESFIRSIVHYTLTNSSPPEQRTGFTVLCRIVALWLEPTNPNAPPAQSATAAALSKDPTLNVSQPIPGFENFAYGEALPACFALPKSGLDYTDAQTWIVIGEISSLLKLLHQKRGNEFLQLLVTKTLPEAGIQLDPAKSQEFVQAFLSAEDARKFKSTLGPFLKDHFQTRR